MSPFVEYEWNNAGIGIRSNDFTHEMINSIFSESQFKVNVFKAIRDQIGAITGFEWIQANHPTELSALPETDYNNRELLEILPESYEEYFSAYKKVVEGGVPVNLEKVVAVKGQPTQWHHITIAKLGDGVVTTLKDVTHAKNQEMILNEHKQLLTDAELLSKFGCWKWSESTNELKWSDGLYALLDIPFSKPVYWSTFLEDVVSEDLPIVEDFLSKVKYIESGFSISYRIKKKGIIHYLSITLKQHSILDTDIRGTLADITEYKLKEEQLQHYTLNQSRIIKELDEKEKKYRTLFERSIDPIFLATNQLLLLNVNNSFLNFSGYSGIEGSGVPLKIIFADDKQFEAFRAKLELSEQVRDFEVYLITKSGEKKFCLLTCTYISDPIPENSCYQGIIHDLTLRKQTENDLFTAERLALTGKIARTIAHEVRNPLTNINLALDQLREEIPIPTDSINQYSNIIERNANRIEELMSEMLNSSKPMKLDLGMISVSNLLTDAIQLAQDRIDLSQIQLHTHYPANLPRVLVDRDKIKIALLNIIINAIEAMTPGEGFLLIHAYQTDSVITVKITDNGKGISSTDLKKMFDPFFTHKSNGMGLGLTSTKNILHSHNIAMEVRSVLDKGTSFYIKFKTPSS